MRGCGCWSLSVRVGEQRQREREGGMGAEGKVLTIQYLVGGGRKYLSPSRIWREGRGFLEA